MVRRATHPVQEICLNQPAATPYLGQTDKLLFLLPEQVGKTAADQWSLAR